MDAMESGKRKRGNCLIRIQSKGSHIIFKCTLTLTTHSIHGHFRWQTTIGAHQRVGCSRFLWAFRSQCSFKGRRPACPFDLHIRRITTTTTTASLTLRLPGKTNRSCFFFLLHFCRVSEVHHHHQIIHINLSRDLSDAGRAAAASPLAASSIQVQVKVEIQLRALIRIRIGSRAVRTNQVDTLDTKRCVTLREVACSHSNSSKGRDERQELPAQAR